MSPVLTARRVSNCGCRRHRDDRRRSATAMVSMTVVAPHLTVTKSHASDLRGGTEATFTISVGNAGSGPTFAPLLVTDSLPPGLAFARATGVSFSCTADGPIV